MPSVLIAGGGVAGLEAALALRDLLRDDVDLTLVTPEEEFVYRPLAPGEPFDKARVTSYPLDRFAHDQAVELIPDSVISVDPAGHRISTQGERELEYEALIVALGADRTVAFEDALTFIDQRNVPGYRELLQRLEAGHVRSLGFLVPNRVVWPFPLYELALMTADFAREKGVDVELTIVTPAVKPLALFGDAASEAMSRMLAERGIAVHAGNEPEVVGPGRAYLQPDGEIFSADAFVALPRLTGPHLRGLPYDSDGFIPTDEHGRVTNTDDVYAAGDCTAYPFKQGGLAAQQADVVASTIAARLAGRKDPEPFHPVLRGVLLTGAGPRFLRDDERGTGSAVAERSLWWPPTKIAGRCLAPYLGALDEEEQLKQAPEERAAVQVHVPLHDLFRRRERELYDFPPRGRGL
jgi:sulfide:quinone oxidoreductase